MIPLQIVDAGDDEGVREVQEALALALLHAPAAPEPAPRPAPAVGGAAAVYGTAPDAEQARPPRFVW